MRKMALNYQLYLLLLPVVAYYVLFHYVPMYGVLIAFKDFSATKGILGSPWVGLEHFQRFFESYHFWTIIRNTLGLSLVSLIVGFPLPIILALLLNQLVFKRYKKFIQTVLYAPHFISVVVLVGMLFVFLSQKGAVNSLSTSMGGERINFMSDPAWFKPLYILSGVWQETGFACIIYLAALSGVNPETHEAAIMDGASKRQRIWNVDIPAILPTAVILLILACGSIMNVGFEKAFLMQTPLNQPSAEIISTYVYKVGLQQADYSFSAAVGLFNSVVNLILLVLVNSFAKRLSGSGLWA
ncbi:putative aldouronate transport system permease protein [Paenibacillus sp. V4I3]|uniref:ABC transporter permease n=1 Tax=Paenibacillus sp. V4I3 TaxID=3042305 RepID=UPI002780119C|nr:ABC transporter permease subunit [Paenibacillus sp. V4I3]MDQ0876540.1 putative aldouronate transport system permease protein [Paenibacillus sp. V4I3]